MEELKERLPEFLSDRLYQIIISNPRSKGEQPGNEISKIKIRPVMVKGEVCFQETVTKGTQVFHENYSKEEALCRILRICRMVSGSLTPRAWTQG